MVFGLVDVAGSAVDSEWQRLDGTYIVIGGQKNLFQLINQVREGRPLDGMLLPALPHNGIKLTRAVRWSVHSVPFFQRLKQPLMRHSRVRVTA